MAGNRAKSPEETARARQKLGLWLSGALLAVLLALVAVALYCLASTPREALCAQAGALATARLLDEAETAYDDAEAAGEDCAGERETVEAQQAKVARRFEAARVHAAIGAPESEPAEPKAEGAEPQAETAESKTETAEKPAATASANATVTVTAAAPTAAARDEKAPKQSEADRVEAEKKAEKAAQKRQEIVEEALGEYVNGLALSPFDESAREALSGLLGELAEPAGTPAVSKRCELVARLAGFGLLAEAGPVYSSLPETSPAKCEQALHELQSQRATGGRNLGEARQLLATEDVEEARERFADALRADVSLVEARNGLEDSIEDESRLDAFGDWLGSVPGALKDALAWIVPLLAALVLGPLLLLLAVWFGVRELSAFVPVVRDWAERNGRHRGLGFLRQAAVPRVSIEEFESADGVAAKGKDFATMFEAAIAKQLGREPGFPFDRVGKDRIPADELKQFTDLLDSLTATKMLGGAIQLLSKLFRRRTIYLSGRLTPLTAQGAGVVLVLEGNGKGIGANVTLWENAFTPKPGGEGAERWLRLVPAAAAWTRWQLAAAHAYPADIGQDRWQADARFQAALAWQVAGDNRRAAALYASTIERDPKMLPAAHNLAVLSIQGGHYEQAEGLVSLLHKHLDGKARGLWPTLELASWYTLALARTYPNVAGEPGASAEALKQARGDAATLVQKLAATLEDEKTPVALRSELEIAEGPSVVLLASLMVECDDAQRRRTADQVASGGNACILSRKRLVENASGHEPSSLVDGYVRQDGRDRSRRTQYNLACYYTRLARGRDDAAGEACRKKAYAALSAALVGGALVPWAREDPALKGLREADPAGFGKIAAGFEVAPLVAEKADEDEPEEPAEAKKKKKKKKKAKAGKGKPPAQ